jgi:hypothetical protein
LNHTDHPMGGNTISSPRSLTCENVADLVDSLGNAYKVYRSVILEHGIDGAILIDYASVDDSKLNTFFVELEVTSGIHQSKFKNCIRAFAEKKQIVDTGTAILLPQTVFYKSLEKTIVKVVTPLKLPDGKYHVFLTHDWGEKGVNHGRVSKVNKMLKEKYGLTTWFDEDRMDGDVRTTMTEGIENSMVMIIFITQRYQGKVIEGGSDNRDNCKVRSYCVSHCISHFSLVFLCFVLFTSFSKFEFKFGINCLGHSKVIPVVMEEGMRDTSLWKGLLRAEIGNLLYVDMTSDDEVSFVGKCEELYRRIAGILHLENVSSSGKSEVVTLSNTSSIGSSPVIGIKHDNQESQKKEQESSVVNDPKVLTKEEESKAKEPGSFISTGVVSSSNRETSTITPVKSDGNTAISSSSSSVSVSISENPQCCLKDSIILTEQTASDLISLFSGTVTSDLLLYRGSRDGFNKGVYHTKCDNQGPHLIIVKCDKGYIFGGYIAVNIPTDGKYVADPTNSSFLFSLKNPKGEIAMKYPIKPKENKHAFYSNSVTYGFYFGYGDMYTYDMRSVNFNLYSSLTYEDYGEGKVRFSGKAKSTIAEVEIWKI